MATTTAVTTHFDVWHGSVETIGTASGWSCMIAPV